MILRWGAICGLHARTGAERYLSERAKSPESGEAYDEGRRRVDQIDRLVRALDDRRDELGLSKAELARSADIAPEAIRRLFSADAPNPTIATLTAIADSLDLELMRASAQRSESLLKHGSSKRELCA